MKVVVLADETALAEKIVDQIQALFRAKPAGVLGTATGSSPLAIYREMGRRVIDGRLSLKDVTSFQLDEYVGLSEGHPQTYRKVIVRDFASFVDINLGRVNAPDGTASDLKAAAQAYEDAIKDAGGVDYQILGIGRTGHIAFNEPGGALDSRTHEEDLTLATRQDNARFFKDDISLVPTKCLTQGLGTIMEARQIGLIALGENKAQAVRDMIEGPVDPACPASVLQNHPNVTVFLDPAAASLLTQNH